MSPDESNATNRLGLLVAAWLWVSVPFAYGAYSLSTKVVLLLHG